ncbi:MAG: hypothetical protein ACREMF_08360 [Gemmatimonadales bacterium]
MTVPDSGRVEVGDSLHPSARALNGRGDPVTADIVWSALDTTIEVVDLAGTTVGRITGTGRLQARVGNLRSNPVTISVIARLDSIAAGPAVRDTVTVSTPDSLSDSLSVRAFGPAGSTAGRTIGLTLTFPPGAISLTLIPGDTVRTSAAGIAVFQVRLTGAPRPDSAVVTAAAHHGDGTPVPGSPITFVVEFQP